MVRRNDPLGQALQHLRAITTHTEELWELLDDGDPRLSSELARFRLSLGVLNVLAQERLFASAMGELPPHAGANRLTPTPRRI